MDPIDECMNVLIESILNSNYKRRRKCKARQG